MSSLLPHRLPMAAFGYAQTTSFSDNSNALRIVIGMAPVSGNKHRADATVLLVLEHGVATRCIFEREAVCRQERWVQFSLLRMVEQAVHVGLPMLLGRAHRQALVH